MSNSCRYPCWPWLLLVGFGFCLFVLISNWFLLLLTEITLEGKQKATARRSKARIVSALLNGARNGVNGGNHSYGDWNIGKGAGGGWESCSGGDLPHIAAWWAQSPPQKEVQTSRLSLYGVCSEGSLAHSTSRLPGKKKSAWVIPDFGVKKDFGSCFSPRRMCTNFNEHFQHVLRTWDGYTFHFKKSKEKSISTCAVTRAEPRLALIYDCWTSVGWAFTAKVPWLWSFYCSWRERDQMCWSSEHGVWTIHFPPSYFGKTIMGNIVSKVISSGEAWIRVFAEVRFRKWSHQYGVLCAECGVCSMKKWSICAEQNWKNTFSVVFFLTEMLVGGSWAAVLKLHWKRGLFPVYGHLLCISSNWEEKRVSYPNPKLNVGNMNGKIKVMCVLGWCLLLSLMIKLSMDLSGKKYQRKI